MNSPWPAARLVIEALRLNRWFSSQVVDRAQPALVLGVDGFVIFGEKALADRARRKAALRTERFQTDYALGAMEGIESYLADIGGMQGAKER